PQGHWHSVHHARSGGSVGWNDDVSPDANELVMAWNELAHPGNTFPGWRTRRLDDARVLPVAGNNAWNDYGLLCVDHGATGWFWELFSAHPNRGGRHGISRSEHVVVLGNFRGFCRYSVCHLFLRS